MEINVGDYVRTKDGYIDQVKSINEKDICGEYPRPSVSLSKCFINCFIDEIAKHSKDIIKLLEKGDVLKLKLIENLYIIREDEKGLFIQSNDYKCYINELRHIKSITTKEQFEANAYTIEKER